MRHDALAVGGNFQTPRPAGSLHFEGAPRTAVDKGFSILIVPAQEHLLLLARRSRRNPDEKTGLEALSESSPHAGESERLGNAHSQCPVAHHHGAGGVAEE